jgi:Cu/Ag efflux pump CusA
MLNRIIEFSLSNKLFVILGVILLISAGTYISQKMDIDVFPDLTAPDCSDNDRCTWHGIRGSGTVGIVPD